MKYLILIASIFMLFSCTTTKTVFVERTLKIYRYPKKVEKVPETSTEKLNEDEPMTGKENIKKIIDNSIDKTTTIIRLRKKIDFYEDFIDKIRREEEEHLKKLKEREKKENE